MNFFFKYGGGFVSEKNKICGSGQRNKISRGSAKKIKICGGGRRFFHSALSGSQME